MKADGPYDWLRTLDQAAAKLARPSTAEYAAQAVRSAILSGGIKRGSALNETQLAAALRVSRNSVREALRLLALEGLVVHQPHQSASVTTITADNVADVFTIRQVLELGAVEVIAKRHRAAQDLSALDRSMRELHRLTGGSDPSDALEADRAFHEALVGLAGSPRLTAAYARIESEIRLCMSISTRAHDTVGELVDQHQSLLDLLRARQFDAFKSDLAMHMASACERVQSVLALASDV